MAFGSAKLGVQIAAGVVTGALSNTADQGISTGTVNLGEVVESGVMGGIVSTVNTSISKGIGKVATSAHDSINKNFTSKAAKNTVKKEVQNRFKAAGRSTSSSAVNREAKATLSNLEAVDHLVVDASKASVDYTVQLTITELANNVELDE